MLIAVFAQNCRLLGEIICSLLKEAEFFFMMLYTNLVDMMQGSGEGQRLALAVTPFITCMYWNLGWITGNTLLNLS